jgi:GYF domain 2
MASEWYYTTNQQQMGPVSWQELRELAESGILKPHDLVWSDGMADWVKAIHQTGLFVERGAEEREKSTGYSDAKPPPGRRTRQRDDDEEDEEDERETRRRKRKRLDDRARTGVGVKIGLILAGALLVLLFLACAGGGLIWLLVGFGGTTKTHTYTIQNLGPLQSNEQRFTFQKGKRVRITVHSTVTHPATDVDLFVVRGPFNNDIIVSDQRKEKDCDVEFVVPATDSYRVQVVNVTPPMVRAVATCKVTIIER